MKKQIKKILLTTLFALTALFTFGQGKFYASLEDRQNEKPVDGIAVVDGSWQMILGGESIKVTESGKTDRQKISNLKYSLFTYENELMRCYKSKVYIVLVVGDLCYYASNNNQASQYYSETINGDLISFSDKAFEKYLDKYGLLDAYKRDKPKREFKDSVNDYFNKEVDRNIKYFKLLNAKMK